MSDAAVLRSAAIGADDLAARLAAAGVAGAQCARVEPSLEDVFLDIAEKAAS